ncbi:HAMP domain-containing histidine kinase [Allopusillimonas ginsengisoli]|nr:HAMP domain-containing histidine kinase [Allopusillimonas ginsengisoli]
MAVVRQSFARLWHSVSFRLTLNYGLLAILTTLILLLFIYFQMMGALRTQQYQQINSATQRLTLMFEQDGRKGLVEAINLTLSDLVDSDREAYLLLDETGRKLAGNLDASFSPSNDMGIFEANMMLAGKPEQGYFRALLLPDGSTLVVGQDTSEIEGVSSLIVQGILTAIVLALLLVLLGTYIFRRELEYRVSRIRGTALKISAGQLSHRIPPSEAEDEFTHLSRDINAMLDQIELLMKGVRHVSDTIAHNLRTPLTRIVGRLRMAQHPDAQRREVLEANRYAIEEIDRLNTLFGKLLQIAEMEAGVRRRAFRVCRLDVIVADVVDMYGALAEDAHVELILHDCGPVSVYGDADLLASACANLLDNAIKYARTSVVIEVVARSGGHACVVLKDDGAGIAPHERERLGEYFYRLSSEKEGHGLGLTSVRAIVALHDGRLALSDAYPLREARGLSACLCLPSAPVQAPHDT